MRSYVVRIALLVAGLIGSTTSYAGTLNIPGGIQLTARSRSEQFYIYGGKETFAGSAPRTDDRIELVPSLCAVSCERVKSAFLTRLGAPDRWKGRICMVIVPTARTPVFDLEVGQIPGNWVYTVLAPDRTRPRDFVQATVRTLLLELANRTAQERSTEIPHWLAEGLTEELMAMSDVDLVVDAPRSGVAMKWRYIRGDQSLISTHEYLQRNVPLTVEELSWPEKGLDNPVFRASAHLLVRRLLELPDGVLAMQRFLQGLPANFNWQTTFLNAFSNQFDSLRSLEKWWLLESSRFTSQSRLAIGGESGGQEVLAGRWSSVESWQRLAEILRTPVQVHSESNALPTRSALSLQSAIEDWEQAPLRNLFIAKVRELDSLQLRLYPSAVSVAREYRAALVAYLSALEYSRNEPRNRAAPAFSLRTLNRDTARHLNLLDARRQQLERAAREVATAPETPAPTTPVTPGRVP